MSTRLHGRASWRFPSQESLALKGNARKGSHCGPLGNGLVRPVSPAVVFFTSRNSTVRTSMGHRTRERCSKFHYTPSGADRVLGNQQSTGASHESRTRLRDARHCFTHTDRLQLSVWLQTSRAGSPPYDGPQGQCQPPGGCSLPGRGTPHTSKARRQFVRVGRHSADLNALTRSTKARGEVAQAVRACIFRLSRRATLFQQGAA